MEVPILPKDSLLLSPCSPVNNNSTPRVLGQSQAHNYVCVEQYETVLQTLRDWKEAKKKLYKLDTKKEEE